MSNLSFAIMLYTVELTAIVLFLLFVAGRKGWWTFITGTGDNTSGVENSAFKLGDRLVAVHNDLMQHHLILDENLASSESELLSDAEKGCRRCIKLTRKAASLLVKESEGASSACIEALEKCESVARSFDEVTRQMLGQSG